jgi:hypothetical protein
MVKTTMPEVFLVGFKLLVGSTLEELSEAAWKSIEDNGCDLVVANDLTDIKANSHKLLLVRPDVGGGQICEPFQTPKDADPNFLARTVVERSIELWRKKESCSASPVA